MVFLDTPDIPTDQARVRASCMEGSAKQDLLTPSSFQFVFWGDMILFPPPPFSVLAAPLARTTGVGGVSP